MALDENNSPDVILTNIIRQNAQQPASINQRDIEQLQDIIIRAHYLSMELRDICAISNVGARHMSLAAGHMLKSWALAFAEELEQTINPPDSP
ncbi:MAG: hypothetical protein ACRCUE_12770 [Bosea sp. (in: a-proteobacteria)]